MTLICLWTDPQHIKYEDLNKTDKGRPCAGPYLFCSSSRIAVVTSAFVSHRRTFEA